MIKVEVQKNLIALQDLLVGHGNVVQRRGNADVTVSKINAGNFPFDETLSLADKVLEINTMYAELMALRPMLEENLTISSMLANMSVHIDQLALWLTVGDNQLSAFKPFAQVVLEDETLAANVNYAMLEDTEIAEDVTITLGTNTHLYVLKGEEFTP